LSTSAILSPFSADVLAQPLVSPDDILHNAYQRTTHARRLQGVGPRLSYPHYVFAAMIGRARFEMKSPHCGEPTMNYDELVAKVIELRQRNKTLNLAHLPRCV
jgi:hypothetical protein